MSNIPLETPNPTDGGANQPVGPTRTAYQLRADQIIQGVDALAALVPRLEFAHVATEHFVRQHRWVPLAFVGTAVAAVEQTPELQSLNKLDLVEARDALQFLDAFKPVLNRIRAFHDSVRFTMSARKAYVAADSLQVYALAKGLARDPGSASIATIIRDLRNDLGVGGRRRVDGNQEPEAPNVSGPRS